MEEVKCHLPGTVLDFGDVVGNRTKMVYIYIYIYKDIYIYIKIYRDIYMVPAFRKLISLQVDKR